MISLKVEWLEAGSLPVYAVEDDIAYFLSDSRELQAIRNRVHRGQRRLIIPTGIDCYLTEFEERLPGWCELMTALDGDNGSFFFPIRTFGQINHPDDLDDLRWFIIAGLAYIPNSAYGVLLENTSPVQAILQALRDPVSQENQEAANDRELRRIARGIQDIEYRNRALALLNEFLNDEQRAELITLKRFHVLGLDGHRYQIGVGIAHNVFRLDAAGQKVIEYCLVTQGIVPVYDLLLTQKVLLETDPETFHKTANSWTLEGDKRVMLNRSEGVLNRFELALQGLIPNDTSE